MSTLDNIRSFLQAGTTCLMGSAQAVPDLAQDQVFFDGGRLWIRERAMGSRILMEGMGSSKPLSTVILPPDLISLDFHEGRFWTRRPAPNGSSELAIQSSPDGRNWHLEGLYRPIHGQAPIAFHPLGDDWFLAVALTAFQEGNQGSRFKLVRKNPRGMFEDAGLLPMGLEGPILTPQFLREHPTADAAIPFSGLTPLARNLPNDFTVRLPDGLAIASGHTGYIWLIRINQGRPMARLVRVFPKVTEARASDLASLEWTILGIQPMPEGDLLVATRSEAAVLTARKLFPSAPLSLQTMRDGQAMETRGKAILASLEAFPDVHWWRLDRHTGKVTPVDPPLNVPSRLEDPRVFSRFRFRPRLDGSLDVRW